MEDDQPILNANTYVIALLNHAQCMEKDAIARICCDGGPDPVYWCEVADPAGGWTLAIQ